MVTDNGKVVNKCQTNGTTNVKIEKSEETLLIYNITEFGVAKGKVQRNSHEKAKATGKTFVSYF